MKNITFTALTLAACLSLSGCQQVNDVVNGNKATNTNTAANTNANAKANSNVTANSNANTSSVVPSNSAANTNSQASNTAANTAAATKQEVPLTPEAKAFAFSLIGEWSFQGVGERKLTFNEDKFEVKNGNNVIDKGSYRVLDEKTVEINSVQSNRKWNATMKVMDDGKKLDWQQPLANGQIEKLELNRVMP